MPLATTLKTGVLRRGLTLLELLIAVALSTLLLAALWQMLGSFAGLYEKGQVTAERAQIARSLQRQLQVDLRTCYVHWAQRRRAVGDRTSSSEISPQTGSGSRTRFGLQTSFGPQPPAPNSDDESLGTMELAAWPPSIRWDARQVGLVGESNAMLVDILKIPQESRQRDAEPMPQTAVEDDINANSPEDISLPSPSASIRRVAYLFHDAAATGTVAASPSRGLLRRSWDYGTAPADPSIEAFDPIIWYPQLESTADAIETDALPAKEGPEIAAASFAEISEITPLVLNATIESDYIPEIAKLRFRYYDGFVWQSSWNSQSAGDLPVAVEIAFDLAEPQPPDHAQPSGDSVSFERPKHQAQLKTGADSSGNDPGLASEQLSDAAVWKPQHRVVVFMRPYRAELQVLNRDDLLEDK